MQPFSQAASWLGLNKAKALFESFSLLLSSSAFFGGEALLHQEMEALRVELKRECKRAANDQKLLAAKRQRLLRAHAGVVILLCLRETSKLGRLLKAFLPLTCSCS